MISPWGPIFTDDYSIRPNNAINYRITLVATADDSSVVIHCREIRRKNSENTRNPADNSGMLGLHGNATRGMADGCRIRPFPGD